MGPSLAAVSWPKAVEAVENTSTGRNSASVRPILAPLSRHHNALDRPRPRLLLSAGSTLFEKEPEDGANRPIWDPYCRRGHGDRDSRNRAGRGPDRHVFEGRRPDLPGEMPVLPRAWLDRTDVAHD